MKCPLTDSQKKQIRIWAKQRGRVYSYRDWAKHEDYWHGFVLVMDSAAETEYGLHLYGSGEVLLVSVRRKAIRDGEVC